MPLTLNLPVGQSPTYVIQDARVKRMLSADHDTAVYMGIWDRIQDLFRHDKKAEVLENLYKLLYPATSDDSDGFYGAVHEPDGKYYTACLHAFRQLKSLTADVVAQNSLSWSVSIDTNNALSAAFHFGNLVVKQRAFALKIWEGRLDLRGIDLRGVNLNWATLRRVHLSGADLSDANLKGVDLSGVDLSEALLRDADLTGAILSHANLSRANLSNAILRDADLTGAILTDVRREWKTDSGELLSGGSQMPPL